MNYQQAIDYLFSALPMYQRIGQAAYKANLDNSLALDRYFNHPHKQFASIHVAGTNGKGSVCHMLAAILQEAGYKTGLYTSPHLKDFRERIRINGAMIPETEVIGFVENHHTIIEEIKPSFFEMTVAMAFDYFAKNKVEIAVVEVGMGGRLDSTNIITPLISIITNIGYDHTQFLGNTLNNIAAEKAGIIKPGVQVVIGETQNETYSVFIDKATECNSPIEFADSKYFAEIKTRNKDFTIFEVNKTENYNLDLGGNYQKKNLQTVLCACKHLEETYTKINHRGIKQALTKVQSSTGLRGRWQVLSENPFTVCDTGHNAEGLRYTMQQVSEQKYRTLHIVFGVVNDKDIQSVLTLLPKDALYYFTKADIPRSLDEKELQERAGQVGLYGKSYPSVTEAITAARNNSTSGDMIYIGGSTFIVAETDLF